jgi:hypothetical protein
MNHSATPEFWQHYKRLPDEIRQVADKNFALMKFDSNHPSIRLKQIGDFWAARVGLHYRALAKNCPGGLAWFWIGHHSVYDKILKK